MVEHLLRDLHLWVIDFEGVTPKGRPMEPTEIAVQEVFAGSSSEETSFSRLVALRDESLFRAFDAEQTGISLDDLRGAASVGEVYAELEHHIPQIDAFVAHHAPVDRALLHRYPEFIPRLRNVPFLDTVKLARALVPGLESYSLDSVGAALGCELPLHRHRALPDVRLTVEVLLRLLALVKTCHPQVRTVEALQALSKAIETKDVSADQLRLF